MASTRTAYGHHRYDKRTTPAPTHNDIDGTDRNMLALPLFAVPACVKTISEITTTVGSIEGCIVEDVTEPCKVLATKAASPAAETEVKQYKTSKLLVCQALIRVSKSSTRATSKAHCLGY
jgi:hypothetical protein